MKRRLGLLISIPVIAFGIGFNPNDREKIEVLSHFDIPASYLKDPYLHDIYSQKKREYGRGEFSEFSENSDLFIPILSSLIAQSDLPSEFLFVALAESQLRGDTASSRGAAGLWQFMESTGKLHGLKVNQYVDERRDHIKSTRAAIAYLSTLKKQFGKWYLALIAYNCGDGRLAKAIRKAKTDDIHVLSDPKRGFIPQESRNYIRKIIALAFLSKDDLLVSQMPLDVSLNSMKEAPVATIYLPEGEEIDRIAAVLEMPKKNLVRLNTHLKKGITPPDVQSYPVYIPQEKLDVFRQKYRTKELKGYFVMHKIKSGETLEQLSKRYNVPKNTIMIENMLGSEERIVNRRIQIPINKPYLKNTRFHTVKRGETLLSVAQLYNLTLEQIKVKNPFAPNVLKEGEEIKIDD